MWLGKAFTTVVFRKCRKRMERKGRGGETWSHQRTHQDLGYLRRFAVICKARYHSFSGKKKNKQKKPVDRASFRKTNRQYQYAFYPSNVWNFKRNAVIFWELQNLQQLCEVFSLSSFPSQGSFNFRLT